MDKRIAPDLFARLMELPPETRTDLLEFLGQTPLAPSEVLRLTDVAAGKTAQTDL